jgi:hypothetical protein
LAFSILKYEKFRDLSSTGFDPITHFVIWCLKAVLETWKQIKGGVVSLVPYAVQGADFYLFMPR